MNNKLKIVVLVPTLAVVLAFQTKAMDDFSQLSLMDKNKPSNQIVSYRGNGQELMEDKVDFTNASQQRVKLTFQYPDTADTLQVDGMVRYMGNNPSGLPHFLKYFKSCLEQYNPGMSLSVEREIVLTGEDSIALSAFTKYVPQNLFGTCINPRDIKLLTPNFQTFKNSKDRPFGNFNYDDNTIMFSMMYYNDSVEIENTYYKYNNLKFVFSPCPEQKKNAGKKVEDFAFKMSDFSYDTPVKLHPNTTNTISKSLSSAYTTSAAIYQYTTFKIEDGLYRLNVKLSSSNSPNDKSFEDRKITNFLLSIK